jgi:hypothetical protein
MSKPLHLLFLMFLMLAPQFTRNLPRGILKEHQLRIVPRNLPQSGREKVRRNTSLGMFPCKVGGLPRYVSSNLPREESPERK